MTLTARPAEITARSGAGHPVTRATTRSASDLTAAAGRTTAHSTLAPGRGTNAAAGRSHSLSRVERNPDRG